MKLSRLVLIAAMASTLVACNRAAPDAGEEAVLIQKPWVFGHGGVVDEPVKTGLSFVALSTTPLYVNVQPQSFDIEFKDMMSSDGIPLDFHATLTLQVTNSVSLVKDWSGGGYRDGTENKAWYHRNIQPPTNNYVRDAFKAHDMHSLAIEASGTAAVEESVKARLSRYITERNIPVRVLDFTLGRVNPPEEIRRQRVRTAEEQQRQETEKQTKIAEDNRKAAEQARAEADNAYRQAMNLSPEQFVDLERIKMTSHVCEGQKCVFINGNATAIVGK